MVFQINIGKKNDLLISRYINESIILNKEIKESFQKFNAFNQKKIIGISYSNNDKENKLKYCKKSALEIGKVDFFYDYGPKDIDTEFWLINYEILFHKRENGYYLWRPYFILKTLKEKMKEGDYLIYTDYNILYKNDVKVLIDFLEKKNEDMWFYKTNYKEKFYAKRDTFILMGADDKYYTETFSYDATFQIYKKTKFSIKFVEDYLYYSKDKRIITDQKNTLSLPNYRGFKYSRKDHSILSLLIKKYNLANSGRNNINYKNINNIESEIPFIFCNYGNKEFKNYDDLLKICISNIDNYKFHK